MDLGIFVLFCGHGVCPIDHVLDEGVLLALVFLDLGLSVLVEEAGESVGLSLSGLAGVVA